MNSSDHHNDRKPEGTHSVPLLGTEAWHRFVTGWCLLACVGIIAMGIARLIDPAEGRAVPPRPMDYVAAACFILLGAQGCRFLIRQFRGKASASTRKH